ncbi:MULTISPECIES: 2-oxoacid:acceptor oxidoreductase family protein [unclassified Fusibacter]|uniref:2-oxoacid:acceptor oxidoreductase family protein n=1 Tax=unclassified Fusibacter TaxID=2624464 RepID=UPI001011F0D2|nr:MULTISPECIES: 2-oxoacid:acceptor oxidoreductase family protein [unclassified Fusibacter]MCK8058821.1 2-oxoacid:acceptor oxidoreductase family protein [Fusibacter sp. A2]NPE21895.1 2-oxoacid:ferredoxin oxidoreductase subunit gamma [Fusibacter sp. A1]RXV61466.1 2-oxoacid:ferredoxin oxidoreductase subunit gamma [Fusibacter sp. A1]
MSLREMRLTGSGGQGLILAGIIFAEAALLDGNNAIQTQSYGPEARGGASKAEVLISTEAIDFPKVEQPDILLALTQIASDKYVTDIREKGILIVDETVEIPSNLKVSKIVRAPILRTAAEVLGKSIVANIVAIGLITELTKVVSRENLEKAVLARVPKGTEDLNRRALEEGYKLAELA